MNILLGIEKLMRIATAADTVDRVMQSESGKKAAEATKTAGRKIKNKVARLDEEGCKKFKYDRKRLSKLFSKDKIEEQVFDYLTGELKYIEYFKMDNPNFEKLFSRIIKAKKIEKRNKAIKKYEKIRDKYIKRS